MIVVADTGPLHYLVLIGAVQVLQPLYTRVLIPRTVASELFAANTCGRPELDVAAPRLVRNPPRSTSASGPCLP